MIQIKIAMSNFHQLRPSYSLQALPSYAQPTQLQSSGFEPVSSLQRLPPSPRQVSVAPEQGHYSLSFRKSAELPPKLNNEIPGSQPPLTFNTLSPHKARLKKSFRPASRAAGDSSMRKNETNSRGKLQDFSRTTSTFLLTTPQKADRQSAFFEHPPLQFQQKGQVFQNSNGTTRWTPQAKENDWGGRMEGLLKEIDSLKRTVESFQRQILRLNQELEESKENRGTTEKLEKELLSRNQHNCYLQNQCMHYLQNCEEKAQALKQAERLLEGLEERNLTLVEQLQKLRLREEQLRCEQQQNLSCKQSELEREKLRLFQDKEMEIDGLVRQKEEMQKDYQYKLKEKEQELNRLIRSVQAQTSKLAEQEHSRQVDRSQISLLRMKIENLTASNQQFIRNVSQYQDQWNTLKEETQRDKRLLEDRVQDLTGESNELERSLRAACQEKCKVELYLESSLTSISAQLAISTAERTRLQEQTAETKERLDKTSIQLLKQKEELRRLTKQLKSHQEQLQRVREAEEISNSRIRSIEAQLMEQEENQKKLVEQVKEQEKEKQIIVGQLQAERFNLLKLEERNQESRSELMEERHHFQEIKYQLKEQIQRQQQLQAKESELLSILEVQKSRHQSQISNLKVQQRCLEKQKAEDWEYSEMVRDGLEQKIMQLEFNLKAALLEKESHEIGTETEENRHRSTSEVEPGSQENYIWVDLEGLQYLCFLLECQPGEEGLLNTIIQKVLSLLAGFEQLEQSAQHYRNLLGMFEIKDGPHSSEKLIQEINYFRENASILLFRMKELEERQEGAESELLRLRSGRSSMKAREKEVQVRQKEGREQLKKMRELIGQLTEEMLRLRARISNSRMNTRNVLDLIRETV